MNMTYDLETLARERRAKAKAVIDISRPESPADCLVTVTLSGNALLCVLDRAQAASAHPKTLAIIDQIRDQLAEQRGKHDATK